MRLRAGASTVTEHLQILPLALIMVMGPQILTAIFLVTSHEPVKNSGAMLIGVVLAASLSILIWFGLVDLIGIDPKEGGSAEPKRAFGLAFLLIFLMPTDIIAVISTVNFLHDNGLNALEGWPLVGATTLLMALPILAYLLLGHRARNAMPGIRDWLTTHSWLVNLVVIIYFIYQTLS
jgi:hypothetical protein